MTVKKLTPCENCKVELSKIGLSPDANTCRNCGWNQKKE